MGMHLKGVCLMGVHFMGVHHRMQPFLLSRTYGFWWSWPDAAFLILALNHQLGTLSLGPSVVPSLVPAPQIGAFYHLRYSCDDNCYHQRSIISRLPLL